jgi:hypothetical protein
MYSGISIYRPRNFRFSVFTMRHLWSRIKFHINNVIYFCIHRSQNCRFSAFIACKSRSWHSISRMVHLRKKLKRAIYLGSVLHTSATCGRLYVRIQSTRIYLRYILFASHVTFSFKSSILALVFSSLTVAQSKIHVRTLHDRLKIIQEVEKNPGEKRVDMAKRLRLPANTLNSIFAKKNKIREQIQKCGNNVRLFLLKKKWFSGLIVSPHSLFIFSTPLKNDRSRFYCSLFLLKFIKCRLSHVFLGKEFSKQHVSLLWSPETGGYFGCGSTQEHFGMLSRTV